MTKLSPAAQAVLDAALPHMVHRYSVAAALRAAADQAEPDDGVSTEVRQVLNRILAIADELEAQ
jgi:type IV secretory pathway VirB2 component (pilin)